MGVARIRFWIESTLAILASLLAIVTIFNREWIEVIFGVDPDRGSGGLEWAMVVGLFAVAIALALVAGWERKHHLGGAS